MQRRTHRAWPGARMLPGWWACSNSSARECGCYAACGLVDQRACGPAAPGVFGAFLVDPPPSPAGSQPCHSPCPPRAPPLLVACHAQAFVQLCGVCKSWQRVARSLFFQNPWEHMGTDPATMLYHPALLFGMVRGQPRHAPHVSAFCTAQQQEHD